MSLMRAGVLAWRISDSPVALSFFARPGVARPGGDELGNTHWV